MNLANLVGALKKTILSNSTKKVQILFHCAMVMEEPMALPVLIVEMLEDIQECKSIIHTQEQDNKSEVSLKDFHCATEMEELMALQLLNVEM